MLVSLPGSPIFSKNASREQSSAYNPLHACERGNQSSRQQNITAPEWAVSAINLSNLAKNWNQVVRHTSHNSTFLLAIVPTPTDPCPGQVHTFMHVLSAHVHNYISKGHLHHNNIHTLVCQSTHRVCALLRPSFANKNYQSPLKVGVLAA